ncbi:MAG TPA: tetratricopeptide repeat protein [Bryobacteraceae bacterium]|nr:tetratricopeptide repeat protein [Bryobacteraceae bacterium]
MTFLALLFFAQDFNAQAIELVRQARDTADTAYHAKAEEALRLSFAKEPDNFEGLKAKTWLLLGRHQFAEALELAKKLNHQAPDDLQVNGFLVDANVELGNYAAAEKAAQWMLDLRPGNAPGLTRAAYLRELYGDIDGALLLMQQALNRTRADDRSDRAWILSHIGKLLGKKQQYANADAALHAALTAYPEYHYALTNLAEIRMEQKNYTAAVEFYRRAYRVAPNPENMYPLGDALSRAGNRDEAKKVLTNFEKAALAESMGDDNANRELVLYYLNHANKPREALRIAQREASRRRDVHTLEVYSMALRKNGKENEANRAVAESKQRLTASLLTNNAAR